MHPYYFLERLVAFVKHGLTHSLVGATCGGCSRGNYSWMDVASWCLMKTVKKHLVATKSNWSPLLNTTTSLQLIELNNRCSLQVMKGGSPISYLETFLLHMCQCKLLMCKKNVQHTEFMCTHLCHKTSE